MNIRLIKLKNLYFLKYSPKRAKTAATNNHWVEASQISTPIYPIPANRTEMVAPPINI